METVEEYFLAPHSTLLFALQFLPSVEYAPRQFINLVIYLPAISWVIVLLQVKH